MLYESHLNLKKKKKAAAAAPPAKNLHQLLSPRLDQHLVHSSITAVITLYYPFIELPYSILSLFIFLIFLA